MHGKIRDYRGMTAVIVALGIQVNLLALIISDGTGTSHSDTTFMATIFGGAIAAIGGFMVGSRAPSSDDDGEAVGDKGQRRKPRPLSTSTTGLASGASRAAASHPDGGRHTTSRVTVAGETPTWAASERSGHQSEDEPSSPETTTWANWPEGGGYRRD